MRPEIIIIGAGGHAKVCIEILHDSGNEIAFCVAGSSSPEHCLGIPVLKGDENLLRLREEGYWKLFVAIGSNQLRDNLSVLWVEKGHQLVNAISSHAIVSKSVNLGNGIALMAGSAINANTTIRDLAIINTGATVDHDCSIGRAVHIAPQCALAGNVAVGDRSFLGIGSMVVPGVSIGCNSTVGAGSVVLSNLDNDSRVAGVPARNLNK